MIRLNTYILCHAYFVNITNTRLEHVSNLQLNMNKLVSVIASIIVITSVTIMPLPFNNWYCYY